MSSTSSKSPFRGRPTNNSSNNKPGSGERAHHPGLPGFSHERGPNQILNTRGKLGRIRDRSRSPDIKRDVKLEAKLERGKGYRQPRTREDSQRQLEERFKNAPPGAVLGLHWNSNQQKEVPYRKDYITGRIRPLKMMDNMYDNMSKQKLDWHREMRQRNSTVKGDEGDGSEEDEGDDEGDESEGGDGDDKQEEQDKDEPDPEVESDRVAVKMEPPSD